MLIAATHGDETIGARIIDKLKTGPLKGEFDYIVGNPSAAELGQRYIDVDLNRVYPGSKNSRLLEERQAEKNLVLAKKYDYVLDIHEVIGGRDIFVILPFDSKKKNRPEILEHLGVGKIVFWPSVSGRRTGPISQFLKNCVEIEIGSGLPKNKAAVEAGVRLVAGFIKSVRGQKKSRPAGKKLFYQVRSKLSGDEKLLKKMQSEKAADFKKVAVNGSVFYPLLIGQYIKDGIVCYQMDLLE